MNVSFVQAYTVPRTLPAGLYVAVSEGADVSEAREGWTDPAGAAGERPVASDGAVSRRTFLAGSAALGAASWAAPVSRAAGRSAERMCSTRPPRFPAGIELYRERFENWAGAIAVDGLWTCAPRTSEEVVSVVNWARAHGYAVRPRGAMHNWSPLVIAGRTTCADRVVLLDTTRHLTAIELASRNPPVVRVQPGARMDRLLSFLGRHGYGFTAVPAPGDVTVGGVLAIAGHGTAVPAVGEERVDGHTFGSVSNLVLSATAVVWSARRGRYVLRRFDRREPGCAALLTHLGRSLLTEVELRTGADQNLRCQSYVDVPADELFAPPGSRSSRTLAEYVRATGRVEVIWFPFTTNPWLKVWSVSPRQPAGSRRVLAPYNYPFSDNISKQAAVAIGQGVVRNPASTPAFGAASLETTISGLASSRSYDLWGASRNLLHYIKPTTERVTANGYAILTQRRDLQRAVSEFVSFFSRLRDEYRSRGQYPMNMPVEIRVTGLDHPQDTGLRTAQPVALSPLAPRADHPEWDVAIWIDNLSFPGTPLATRFYGEFERWALRNYRPPYACARPEWSKGWAYTDVAAWANRRTLSSTIPAMYSAGRPPGQSWHQVARTLRAYDPHRVLTNSFLDALI